MIQESDEEELYSNDPKVEEKKKPKPNIIRLKKTQISAQDDIEEYEQERRLFLEPQL